MGLTDYESVFSEYTMYFEGNLLRIISTSASLLLIWFVWSAVVRPRLFDVIRDVPWPKTARRGGFLSRLLSEPTGPELHQYIKDTPNQGLIQYTGILGKRRILVTSPELINETLNQKAYILQKTTERKRRLSPILGNGLVIAEGEDAKFQRKHLMPAFAYRHINSLSPLFWAKTAELVEKIRRDIRADIGRQGRIAEQSSIVNISDLAARITFDVIGVAAFGNDFGTLLKPDTAMFQDYLRVFYNLGRGTAQLLELVLPTKVLYNLPVRRVQEIKGAITAMRHECRTIVERNKAEYAASGNEKADILSIALRANVFTDEDLTDQMLTFLGAGHATTAVALEWAIHFLAEHPGCQQRLREEIRAFLPNPATNDMNNTYQLETLPYLNACLNETLRVIPLVSTLQRETAVEIDIGGQVIPAGSILMMSLWSLQRCEKTWGPDAAEFRPERWLEEEEQGKKAKYANLSFGQGPRNCIGMSFARKELETILVGLICCFDIKPVDHEDPLPMFFDVLAKPQEDLRVRVEALAGW